MFEDSIILDYEDFIENKTRGKRIIDELDELDDSFSQPGELLSQYVPKKEKKEKKKKNDDSYDMEEQGNYDSSWLETLSAFKVEPIKRKKSRSDIFESYMGNGKKKKKKKKNKDDLTDFNKEFEKEQLLIKNLLQDQNKFTNDLQRKYDLMEVSKSSARGIGKFTTDLIDSINQARSLSMQLIDKQVNIKKTIADLSMKEKKELGKGALDGEDMGLYSSRFLKEMLSEKAAINSMGGSTVIDDVDPDDLFNDIDNMLGESDAEADKYLEYENRNVTIYACINKATDEKYFQAYDEDGNYIDDYPLPMMTKLNINYSTNVATDVYSKKYPIKWV